jgi:hypothetical protein
MSEIIRKYRFLVFVFVFERLLFERDELFQLHGFESWSFFCVSFSLRSFYAR